MRCEESKVYRDLAFEVLIKQNVTKLPISVTEICKKLRIEIKYYIPKDNNSGISMIIGEQPFIFVNQNKSIEHRRFTAAHELGHILLGHVGKYQFANNNLQNNDIPIERAADEFAIDLLAPACVIWGCGVKNADDIAELCRISKQAAEYRIERTKILYEREAFLTTKLEKQIYANFKNFIETNKL